MIRELLGGAAMDQQLKSVTDGYPTSLPMILHPIVSNPSPTSSSSAQQQPQRSTSATPSPQGQGAAEQAPLPCPRCNSSNTKFCYYNNYNLTQPRHFCKTCRRYWTKGGALRNVPIGGGCRRPRLFPTPATKPAAVSSCKAAGASGPQLGLGVGTGMGMGGAGTVPSWATTQQAAAAQLMALLNSARGVQVHGGSSVHRFLGLDGMAPLALGHHDVLSNLELKLPPSPASQQAASYYGDQLHAVVSNAERAHGFDAAAATSLPYTTAVTTSLPPAVSSVSAALGSATAGLDLPPPVSFAAHEMQYWGSPAAMTPVAWPDF